MERACDYCGRTYEAQTSRSRYCCTSCRARACDRGMSAPASPDVVKTLPVAVAEPVAGDVEAATAVALSEAGRSETPLGCLALSLARRVDNSQRETGQAVAALARQLAATLEGALAGAGESGD